MNFFRIYFRALQLPTLRTNLYSTLFFLSCLLSLFLSTIISQVVTADEVARGKAARLLPRTTNTTIARYNKTFSDSLLQVVHLLFNHTAHVNYETERMILLYSFWSEAHRQLPNNKTLNNIPAEVLSPRVERTLAYINTRRARSGRDSQNTTDALVLLDEKLVPAPLLTPATLSSTVSGTNDVATLNLHHANRMSAHMGSKEAVSGISSNLTKLNSSVDDLKSKVTMILDTARARKDQREERKANAVVEGTSLSSVLKSKNDAFEEEREQLLQFHEKQMAALNERLNDPIVLPEVSITANSIISTNQNATQKADKTDKTDKTEREEDKNVDSSQPQDSSPSQSQSQSQSLETSLSPDADILSQQSEPEPKSSNQTSTTATTAMTATEEI